MMRRPMLWMSCAALALASCYGNSSADEELLDDELGEGTIESDDGGAAASDGAAGQAAASDAGADSSGCSGGDLLAQLACQLGGQAATRA